MQKLETESVCQGNALCLVPSALPKPPHHNQPVGNSTLSLDHLGWSFTAGDGPESSKCQLSRRRNHCLRWLGGGYGTGWQQQHLLPWFPSAHEDRERAAELQLGLSPQVPTQKVHDGRALDLTEQQQDLAQATTPCKAQH